LAIDTSKEIFMQKAFTLLTLILTLASLAACQEKRPSPSASASCSFSDGKTIKTDYSSPRAKGRKIYGGLVPYGEVWRLGANEATTLVTNTNLTAGGKDIPAGSYTLFAVPSQDKWTLVISKKTGEWGVPYPEGEDFARADMKASKLPSAMENFTISYDQKGGNCVLNADWENTRASIEFAEKK
jgi:Protein of unknown function (DUF2911)